MANPLQPKCIAAIENLGGYCINLVSSSRSGDPDIIACIKSLFYGFEIKWKSDQPSELQKQKINDILDAGGRAYFIRSVEQLIYVITHDVPPVRYEVKTTLKL